MTQPEFDFGTRTTRKAKGSRVTARPHHRTTTLTTDARTYMRLASLPLGGELSMEFVNDIVSSARGGQSKIHHPIRRATLLRNQLRGDFRHVKVRAEQGECLNCVMVSLPVGPDDACSGKIVVSRTCG